MSKPLIVIADMDTAYLAELENKFLVELGDRAELEIDVYKRQNRTCL